MYLEVTLSLKLLQYSRIKSLILLGMCWRCRHWSGQTTTPLGCLCSCVPLWWTLWVPQCALGSQELQEPYSSDLRGWYSCSWGETQLVFRRHSSEIEVVDACRWGRVYCWDLAGMLTLFLAACATLLRGLSTSSPGCYAALLMFTSPPQ